MGNTIQIKHGSGAPVDRQLKDREFGFDNNESDNDYTSGKQLYLGTQDGKARKILSEDDNNTAHTNNIEIGGLLFLKNSQNGHLSLKWVGNDIKKKEETEQNETTENSENTSETDT